MKHRTARGISFVAISTAGLLFGTFAYARGQRQPPPRRPEAAPRQIIVVTSPTEPSTKLEALSAQTGVVVVQRSTTIGELSGKGGSVIIEVKEFIDTGNPNQRVTGLGLLVKNQAEALSHTSLVDYDEIDSLVQAIDYISKLSQSAVPGKDIEVAFKTKGGFAVWASNRGKSEVIAAVSSQGQEREVAARINLSDLPQLKRLIQDAKAEIDAAPQSGNQ